MGTNPFDAFDALAPLATVPGVLLNKSVKYLPPTTCGLPPLSPTNNLSPLFACVPPPLSVTPTSPNCKDDGAVVPVDLLLL